VHLSAEAVPALAAILLAGACLGFLPHNFHPARIFMGDTGSMLLGLLLAYVPISAINSLDYTSLNYKANRYAEILPLLLPAAVMVIPYVDMLRAVVRRTRAGQSPFAADRKHLHHTMLEIGHSHRSSVLILYAWAALFSAAVVGLSIATVSLAVLVWITLAAVLALALLSIPKLRWWERNRPELAARGSRMPAASQLAATQPGDQTAPVPVLASRPTFLAESAPPGQWPAEAGADGNGAVRLPENGSSVRWPGDQADGDRAQFSARGQAAGESVPPFEPPAAAEPAAQPVARASGSIIP
jgi:UDP-GlcNAc:undecaprenyl-phosphate GlcNAc-1-phosphate transferase